MTSQKLSVALKRAYDEPAASDGTRVLVERLWPRGLSKERARIDFWLKDVAPSTELRKWYSRDPQKFQEFRHRYETELQNRDSLHSSLLLVIPNIPVLAFYKIFFCMALDALFPFSVQYMMAPLQASGLTSSPQYCYNNIVLRHIEEEA